MPTPDLFDFDEARLAHYDPSRVREALTGHPALYLNHLEIAQYLEGFVERRRMTDEPALMRSDNERQQGYVEAIRDVIAHLRQADYLPGAVSGYIGDGHASSSLPRTSQRS